MTAAPDVEPELPAYLHSAPTQTQPRGNISNEYDQYKKTPAIATVENVVLTCHANLRMSWNDGCSILRSSSGRLLLASSWRCSRAVRIFRPRCGRYQRAAAVGGSGADRRLLQ